MATGEAPAEVAVAELELPDVVKTIQETVMDLVTYPSY